jgi:LEA14-like dessication related protein
MRKRKNLWGLVMVVICLGVWDSCSKPQPVSFAGYRNVRLSNQGFSTGVINMDIAFYNPNPFPMKIKEATLNLSIDRQPFGRIVQDSERLMPARDTFLMPVSIRVNLVDLLSTVLNSSRRDSVSLEAKGSCKVGRKGVFVNLPLHYHSREILNMF